jgi:hypothetical protein
MSAPAIAPHDLQRRRLGTAAPVASELHALLDDLRREGVDPPAEAARALALLADTRKVYESLPDRNWLAHADLDSLDPQRIIDHLRLVLTDTGLHSGAGTNIAGHAFEALVTRATAAVVADTDRICDDLRPAWDAAAAVVHTAAAAGIRGATTAAQVIEMGDDAVNAWRTLAQPLATLDRLHRLRNRLLFFAGRELADHDLGEQRWLDRASAAPPQLHTTETTWEQARMQRLAPGTLTASADPVTDNHDDQEEGIA